MSIQSTPTITGSEAKDRELLSGIIGSMIEAEEEEESA